MKQLKILGSSNKAFLKHLLEQENARYTKGEVQIDNASLKGNIYLYELAGMLTVRIYDMQFKEDISISYFPDEKNIGVYCFTANDDTVKFMGSPLAHDFICIKTASEIAIQIKASQQFRLIYFGLNTDIFDEYWHLSEQNVKRLIDAKTFFISQMETAHTKYLKEVTYHLINNKLIRFGKVMSIAFELLNHLFYDLEQRCSSIEQQNKHDIEQLLKIRDELIKEHSPASFDNLAFNYGYSPSVLRRHFKEVFGQAPMSYVKTYKLAFSIQLLVDMRNVKHVSQLLGYRNATSFSLEFRKFHGFTPSEALKMYSNYKLNDWQCQFCGSIKAHNESA